MSWLRKLTARQLTACFAVAVGLVFLTLYLACLCPTTYWSDAGELIASSVEPGIAHPNGSPLYTLLGWVCSRLPVGPLAWRVGLLSALAAAAAVALVLACARRLDAAGGSPPGGAFGWLGPTAAAVLLGVAPGLWQKAVTVNKYPLALAISVLALLVNAAPGGSPLWLGVLLGLGYAAHPFTLCTLPLALLTVARAPRGKRLRTTGQGLLGLALGLLPFLYLPLRSMTSPVRDWGHPATLSGFWWVVSGQEFGGLILGAPVWEWLPNLATVAGLLARDLGVPGLLLAVAGLGLGLVRCRTLPALGWLLGGLVLVGAADLVLVVTYNMTSDRYTWDAYLLPLYAVLALLAARGLGELRRGPGHGRRALAAVAVVFLLANCVWTAARTYPLANKSHLTSARDFALRLHANLDPGVALVHNSSETEFLLMYLVEVENARPVTTIYLPLLSYSWYGDQLHLRHPGLTVPNARTGAGKEFIALNHRTPLLAYPGGLGHYVPDSKLKPDGLLYRVHDAASWVKPRPPAAPDQIVADARAADYDGRTVSAALNLLHAQALHAMATGSPALAERALIAALDLGANCRAREDGDVKQITASCHLTRGIQFAALHQWEQARTELDLARPLSSGKLRAEREVRLALLAARQGGQEEVLDRLRRAAHEDPTHPMAQRLLTSLGLSP